MPRLARMFLVGAVVLLVVVVAALSSQRERRDPASGSRTVSVAASADGHCRQRLAVRAGNHSEGEVVVCANRQIEEHDATVDRLVVVIHGDRRNAPEYYGAAMQAAEEARAEDVLIVAPRFPTRDDLNDDESDADLTYWDEEGWKQGNLSEGPGDEGRVSSFSVVDRVLDVVARRYSALEEVVIAGHSAGAQWVNRYAASSPAPERLGARGITTTFVVANPSSYLYLDEQRPHGESTDAFARPPAEVRDDCPGYNDYKYGLEDPNDYLREHGSADEVRDRYLSRRVIYLLGGDDDDSDAHNLDRSCAAELQGRNRLERGEAFYNYLGDIGGSGVYSRQLLSVIPDVGHDAARVFRSEPGMRALFG